MLYLQFYKPEGLFSGTMNRLAAWVTGGPYAHCDFVFKLNEDQVDDVLAQHGLNDIRENRHKYMRKDGHLYLCVHVYWGDEVAYRVLIPDHVHPYWNVPELDHAIDCTWDDEKKIFRFCMDQLYKPYDYVGAMTFYLPSAKRGSDMLFSRYFCSQLCTHALQHVGRLLTVNPRRVTPNRLHRLLL